MKNMDHTFAVCAYKESAFLDECICSLNQQTEKSRIIVCTSTPNDHIRSICDNHGLELFINPAPSNIATDWNFALEAAQSSVVTLCHQDDIYEADYWKVVKEEIMKYPDALICFTDYGELRNGLKVDQNKLLCIKRLLLWPMRIKKASAARWAKRLSLALGNPICCPAVTFRYTDLPHPMFEKGMKASLDWQAWETLSKLKGRFCYVPEILMYHRIYEESTTSEIIGENLRTQEDYQMFLKFWPNWIAKLLSSVYASSQKSNQV